MAEKCANAHSWGFPDDQDLIEELDVDWPYDGLPATATAVALLGQTFSRPNTDRDLNSCSCNRPFSTGYDLSRCILWSFRKHTECSRLDSDFSLCYLWLPLSE